MSDENDRWLAVAFPRGKLRFPAERAMARPQHRYHYHEGSKKELMIGFIRGTPVPLLISNDIRLA